jgi:sporulation protein YlmC with PRC-barrel domain
MHTVPQRFPLRAIVAAFLPVHPLRTRLPEFKRRSSAQFKQRRIIMVSDIHPRVLSASTLEGDKVTNAEGENLGEVKELMIDLESGRVAYAVLEFGGFLGLGDKLFAVPWEAFDGGTQVLPGRPQGTAEGRARLRQAQLAREPGSYVYRQYVFLLRL